MPDEPLRLAELLVTRLCHDLSGQIGTVSGALEMAGEEAGGEAIGLASEAIAAAIARLKLVRVAWGGPGGPLSGEQLGELLGGLATRRVRLDLSGLPQGGELPAGLAQAVLNGVMLATECLPAGGTVSLAPAGPGLVVRVEGPRAAWPDGFAAALIQSDAAWAGMEEGGSRRVQAPFLVLAAGAAGVRLSLLLGGPADVPPPLLIEPAEAGAAGG